MEEIRSIDPDIKFAPRMSTQCNIWDRGHVAPVAPPDRFDYPSDEVVRRMWAEGLVQAQKDACLLDMCPHEAVPKAVDYYLSDDIPHIDVSVCLDSVAHC